MGSPPRMRGKGVFQRQIALPLGITPAYAGKRVGATGTSARPEDHPRVCGEKFWPRCRTAKQRGSPPRMRGKGSYSHRFWKRHRITPAYAGKRNLKPSSAKICGDHPRVCGEKRPQRNGNFSACGSPPRMRGKVGILDAQDRRSGDHPRVCGEKGLVCGARLVGVGSPPRMRGKVGSLHVGGIWERITPAYAGKSRSGFCGCGSGRDHPRVCGEKPFPLPSRRPLLGSPPRMRGKAFI